MGLYLIRNTPNFDFTGKRRFFYAISGAIILLGLISLVFKGGPRYGIDFAGGMMVQVKFDKVVQIEALDKSLEGLNLPGLTVQRFGLEGSSDYLIRVSTVDIETQKMRDQVSEALTKGLPGVGHSIQRLEMVGPKVGADLRSKALEAMFYAILLISIYISGRFEHRWEAAGIMAAGLAAGTYLLGQVGMPTSYLILASLLITVGLAWKLKLNYALGVIISLVHDVIVVVGVFSLLNKEIDLTVIAAILTIIGYSMNDTIIVYDRIRENIRARSGDSFDVIINKSVNQTLSRTILTSGTVMIVVICLLLFGGNVIHDFAVALFIGVVAGSYSSVFVASPVLLALVPPEEWSGERRA